MLDLSIVIVNYNTAKQTAACIGSIYDHTKGIQFEVILVDNHSQDNSKTLITQSYPQVRWIDMGYNSGFARANNAGIRGARGRYVLLLNSDIILFDNAISKSVLNMDLDKKIVAAGCQLLNVDGSLQKSGGTFEDDLRFWFGRVPYWRRIITPFLKIFWKSTDERVEWIMGAYLIVRREAISEIGLLDEDFFMYAEEIEWCSRLSKKGVLTIFKDIKVIHTLGASSKKVYGDDSNSIKLWSKRERQRVLSVQLWIRKQYGLLFYLLLLINYVVAIPAFLVGRFIHCMIDLDLSNMRQPFEYLMNVVVWIKYAPKLISNRRFFYKI